MELSRRVALNGTELDSIDERIVISGVEEDPPEESRNTVVIYGGAGTGSWVTSEQMSKKRITVRFLLRINKREYSERSYLLERIRAWARPGGVLTSSTRPDRKIRVRNTQKPAAPDPRKLATEYTMVFEAYEKPYWENITPVRVNTVTANAASVRISLDGDLSAKAGFEIRNMSGAMIQTVNVSCGGNSMAFSSLGLGANETLVLDYDEKNIQRIRIRSAGGAYRSAMDKRSGSDDFPIEPGETTVSFSAQRACQMTVICAGRYA